MSGRGHVWQRAMHGRGHVWWGHVWQGTSMHGKGVCMAGEMATAVDGTHPTGMHSCSLIFLAFALAFAQSEQALRYELLTKITKISLVVKLLKFKI